MCLLGLVKLKERLREFKSLHCDSGSASRTTPCCLVAHIVHNKENSGFCESSKVGVLIFPRSASVLDM